MGSAEPPRVPCDSAGAGKVPEPLALPSPAPSSLRSHRSLRAEARATERPKYSSVPPPSHSDSLNNISARVPGDAAPAGSHQLLLRSIFATVTSPKPLSFLLGRSQAPPLSAGQPHSQRPPPSCRLLSAALPAGAAKPGWLCTTAPANAFPPPASRRCSEEQRLHRGLPSLPGTLLPLPNRPPSFAFLKLKEPPAGKGLLREHGQVLLCPALSTGSRISDFTCNLNSTSTTAAI